MNKLLQIEPCREHFSCSSCKSLYRGECMRKTQTGFHSFPLNCFFFLAFPHKKMGDYIHGNNKNTIMEKLINFCLLNSEMWLNLTSLEDVVEMQTSNKMVGIKEKLPLPGLFQSGRHREGRLVFMTSRKYNFWSLNGI